MRRLEALCIWMKNTKHCKCSRHSSKKYVVFNCKLSCKEFTFYLNLLEFTNLKARNWYTIYQYFWLIHDCACLSRIYKVIYSILVLYFIDIIFQMWFQVKRWDSPVEGETDPGSQRRSSSQGVTGQASRGEQGRSADQESNQSGRGISFRYQGNSRPNLSSARKN